MTRDTFALLWRTLDKSSIVKLLKMTLHHFPFHLQRVESVLESCLQHALNKPSSSSPFLLFLFFCKHVCVHSLMINGFLKSANNGTFLNTHSVDLSRVCDMQKPQESSRVVFHMLGYAFVYFCTLHVGASGGGWEGTWVWPLLALKETD